MDGYGVLLSKMMWWCETAVQLQKFAKGRQAAFLWLGNGRRTVGAKEEGNK